MQAHYCDICGTRLSSDNWASRKLEYSATRQPNHILLPNKEVNITLTVSIASDAAGMSRIAANNGDFCTACVEGVIVDAILQKQMDRLEEEETETEADGADDPEEAEEEEEEEFDEDSEEEEAELEESEA